MFNDTVSGFKVLCFKFVSYQLGPLNFQPAKIVILKGDS